MTLPLIPNGPEPYYVDEQSSIVLYCGDARELLGKISCGNTAVVITDPPYGIGLESHGQRFVRDNIRIAGDDDQTVGREVLDACNPLPVIAFASPMKPWPNLLNRPWRQCLVWDKGPAVGVGGDRETCWKMTWELIQVGRVGELNGQRDEAVLRHHVTQNDFPFHPAQKPLSLMRNLIWKTKAATIVDPFAGSGSTLVAAKLEGRGGIGIEINPDYCAIAKQRLRQSVLPFNA